MIELLLVVLLVSVIAGMVIPNLSQMLGRTQLKTSVNDLAFIMRYAQSRAVVGGQSIELEVNESEQEYRLKAVEEVSFNHTQHTPLEGRYGKRFKLPKGVELKVKESTLMFYPNGTMDKGEIYVCSKAECYTVSTREQRGMVKVLYEQS